MVSYRADWGSLVLGVGLRAYGSDLQLGGLPVGRLHARRYQTWGFGGGRGVNTGALIITYTILGVAY